MAASNPQRRQCIPVLYTKGTHYEVGLDVGRTFAAPINSFLKQSICLQDFSPYFETSDGRKNYELTLSAVKNIFPEYIDELEGIATGANVPFHQLFLLHMDDMIFGQPSPESTNQIDGCSTVIINNEDYELIGHTEDADMENLGNFYLVSAHVITENPRGKYAVKEEKFTSLCYPGHLPGYTMSYNYHGLIFTINTLSALKLLPGRIPRHFITRALLATENYEQAIDILKNSGAGDGCSLNLTFLQTTPRIFYNIEMAPAYDSPTSGLNIVEVKRGENSIHCNAYLRTKIEEVSAERLASSRERLQLLEKTNLKTLEDAKKILGDESGTFTIFRDVQHHHDRSKTIAVGVFDCKNKTWSIYADNPSRTNPTVVLPLDLKKN